MHHLTHHLGAFWIAFAVIRHPLAGIGALAVAGVVGLFWRKHGNR